MEPILPAAHLNTHEFGIRKGGSGRPQMRCARGWKRSKRARPSRSSSARMHPSKLLYQRPASLREEERGQMPPSNRALGAVPPLAVCKMKNSSAQQTESEAAFESYLDVQELCWSRVPQSVHKEPDYRSIRYWALSRSREVEAPPATLICDELPNFSPQGWLSACDSK